LSYEIVIMTGKKPHESYLWFFISFPWHVIHPGCTQSIPFVTINSFKCVRYIWVGVANWCCELVKEEGCGLDMLQASWCKFKITSIKLKVIRYSMIFFVLFGGQEGFGYFIFLWRCEFRQVLRNGIRNVLRNVLHKLYSRTVELVFLNSWLPIGFPGEPRWIFKIKRRLLSIMDPRTLTSFIFYTGVIDWEIRRNLWALFFQFSWFPVWDMFLRHVFWPAGDEFKETERGFSLEWDYIQKPF